MKKILLVSILISAAINTHAQLLSSTKTNFNIANATIYVDSNDFVLVKKSVQLLQNDIEAVTGKRISIINKFDKNIANLIVIGSLTNAAFVKALVKEKQFNPENIQHKWEAFQIQKIKNNLCIIGNDRRGTVYGVFELSKQIGVSPWYWWADVPIKKQKNLFIKENVILTDAPKVKYRGIFINDEAPAFSGWTKEKFGGVNHVVYEKIFELILRLKGNYLWPAMWGNAFNDDDKLNPIKADEWGIVMGTSHHEPMLRAQQEWKRYGKGTWDFTKNDSALKSFWRKGIENMGNHESIVTIAMRGDGDEPMTRETATTLLEKIVFEQRKIIEEVTKKPASETPQLWALYKEVQDYYDKGMRVPDDVTLLLCDDNWGNIRKLPKLEDKPRKGGYGIYYHFDYVGGPRNYKWLNTNTIAKIWQQMNLAWEYNARQIWIVNVGDIKPMEFPISFFLDYAWNPEKINANDLPIYTKQWAAAQFGNTYAKEIADCINDYTKFNARKKPELLNENTYNINNNEWSYVVTEYNNILKKATLINNQLDGVYKNAFFQLVLHPIKACANLNEMYYYTALNKKAYQKHFNTANGYAEKVKELYLNDSLISLEYNQLNNGKWNHMMDQTHIGYTNWQQPNKQKMPTVYYVNKDSIINENKANETDERVAIIPNNVHGNIFFEREHYGVSIEASHFTKAVNSNGVTWQIIPNLGRTGSAITTYPVKALSQKINNTSPHLQYEFYTYSKDKCIVKAYFTPTLNYHQLKNGLQYAISIDDETPKIISVNVDDTISYSSIWNKWVADNIIIKTSNHSLLKPGKHILKYWMIDSNVCIEKLVVDFGNTEESYLGPSETRLVK